MKTIIAVVVLVLSPLCFAQNVTLSRHTSTNDLCAAYNDAARNKYHLSSGWPEATIVKFLKEQHAFTVQQWYRIKHGGAAVGISEAEVICIYGYPDHINKSAFGPDQWVYTDSEGSQIVFIYLQNGVVTDWQSMQ